MRELSFSNVQKLSSSGTRVGGVRGCGGEAVVPNSFLENETMLNAIVCDALGCAVRGGG